MKKFATSKQFTYLQSLYRRVDDVYGGTDTMRAGAERYLPKGPAEPLGNYVQRLERAVMKPIYSRTIEKGAGKAFAKGIATVLPPLLEPMIDNADGAGTSLETFSKQLLKDAIHYGITYLLVDYPITTPNATLADERAAGAYPYFVNITPTQVCDLRTAYIASKVEVVYFRFKETIEEFSDTYELTEINQVKEFVRQDGEIPRVIYNIYRKDKDNNEYLYDTNVMMGLTSIPLVPVYGNKTGHFIGEPTLLELANQSISHWRQYAGYLNIIEATGTPMLQVKGLSNAADESGEITEFVVSPNTAYMMDAQGSLEWTEIGGSAASSLLTALKDLEASMAGSGLDLVAPNNTAGPVQETATGRLLDAAEANSILKSIVIDLTWSLYWAFVRAGDMVGVDATSTEVNIDTSYTVVGDSNFGTVMEMYSEGIITAQELLEEAKTRGLFQSETLINKEVVVLPTTTQAPVEVTGRQDEEIP